MVPTVFSGKIIYSVNPAVSLYGLSINYTIGSSFQQWKAGTVQSGNNYEIMVDPMGVSGVFHFYIGDVEAVETGTYVKGGFILQDLTINTIPTGFVSQYCGDGLCNNGESCSSCSGDCGGCSSGHHSSGGSSSGGSSGGSSSNTAIVLTNPTTNTNTNTNSNPGSGGVAITGNTVADSTNSKGIMGVITSGAVLIALIIAVIVLGIIVLVLPKRK
jgi:hypothetical protein